MENLTQVYWATENASGMLVTSKTHLIEGANPSHAICGVYVPDYCDAGYDGGESFCKRCEKISDKRGL